MIPLRDTHRSSGPPWVVLVLIACNLVVFGLQLLTPPQQARALMDAWALVPDRLLWHSLGSYMFMHGGWMHLIGNLWFLWIFGDNVEDALGHSRFLIFYLLCGITAGLVHVLAESGSPVPTVGASGAIAGVMGAYMVRFPRNRILTLVPIVVFITTVEIPAVFMLLYWFLIQVVSGAYATGKSAAAGGTAWFAHIGGFLVGAFLAWLLRTRKPQPLIHQGEPPSDWPPSEPPPS
ncbi:MAG: rhomboid family intramembrane serine protease [Bryobacterales bacterium]|jgi:membrane associated rhomboid family serine protease|nr:rhomboid family intramembrane serine protease [Bryobacterales bacterium]